MTEPESFRRSIAKPGSLLTRGGLVFASDSPVRQAIQAAGAALLDLLYPPVCVQCGRVGQLLCDYCSDDILPAVAANPLAPEALDYTAVGVHTGALRRAIHVLKYENEPRMARTLGRLLAEKVMEQNWSLDTVIPVPLHITRLQQRGYNQANKIAQALASQLGIPLLPGALIKVRATQSQVELSAADRQKNVEGAFAVVSDARSNLTSRTILLVDDVCTTGSTLRECALALNQAGAAGVFAATVSRAQFSSAGRPDDALV